MKNAAIRDAVTALLFCRGELLMTRRQPHLPSFSGFTAFPGGKVEASDAETPTQLRAEDIPTRLLAGLVREIREELAIDLDALALAGQVLGVHELGIATTPPVSPLRFRTHFFRVDLAEKPAITLELGELAEAEWALPIDWLARYLGGRLLLAPPTLDALNGLAAEAGATRIAKLAEEDYLADRLRSIEPLYGLRMIFVRSNTLPPATHTNAFLIGDSHRVLVDPSPADREELARLKALLDVTGVDEILLTHHHPDHRQFANELAAHYDVPLAMSEDTRQRIAKLSPGWFGELLLRIYTEGDVVTRWLGQAVRVLPVPGHDEGQIALLPDGREWCLVGDLIQGIGTVVIAQPEGHMGRYFASLEKVIALAPAVIFPSHGMGLGTTYRLSETLKHRRLREDAVLQLHQGGKAVDEMLPLIYQGLDPRLLPLARMNIESHLQKLREEGRLAA